jgi:hypothetical protein
MKLTPLHFEQFKKECVRLQNILGLRNWTLYYEHKQIKCIAVVEAGIKDNVATVTLTKETGKTPVNILETARHEMWHLFHWKLRRLAMAKTRPTEEEIDHVFEEMSSTLEKLDVRESSDRAEL